MLKNAVFRSISHTHAKNSKEAAGIGVDSENYTVMTHYSEELYHSPSAIARGCDHISLSFAFAFFFFLVFGFSSDFMRK